VNPSSVVISYHPVREPNDIYTLLNEMGAQHAV